MPHAHTAPAAEEPQRLLDRPSERQRQHPSLPPEPIRERRRHAPEDGRE